MMQLEGQRELFVNLEKNERATTRAAMEGLKNAGLNIIADAKDNLKNNGSISSNMLRKSGRVQKAKDDKQSVDVGFFSSESKGGYAYYVEYGRRSGGMPFPPDLVEWLRKKNLKNRALVSAIHIFNAKRRKRKDKYTKADLLLSAAWSLAKHIAKNGTKPHPFFQPAIDKNEQAVADAIAIEVNKEIQ